MFIASQKLFILCSFHCLSFGGSFIIIHMLHWWELNRVMYNGAVFAIVMGFLELYCSASTMMSYLILYRST